MATNNLTQPQARKEPAKSLLSSLALKAEHMIAIGCLGLLLTLTACGFGGWYLFSNWTTAADPAPQERSAVGIEPPSIPDCEGRGLRLYTQDGKGGTLIYSCGR